MKSVLAHALRNAGAAALGITVLFGLQVYYSNDSWGIESLASALGQGLRAALLVFAPFVFTGTIALHYGASRINAGQNPNLLVIVVFFAIAFSGLVPFFLIVGDGAPLGFIRDYLDQLTSN